MKSYQLILKNTFVNEPSLWETEMHGEKYGMAREIDMTSSNSPQLANQRIFHMFFAEHNNQESCCTVLSAAKKKRKKEKENNIVSVKNYYRNIIVIVQK